MQLDPVAIANAGGLAIAVLLVSGILTGAVRGWWVPGFVYRREVKRGDDQTVALLALNKTVDQVVATNVTNGKSIDALTDQVRWLERGNGAR